jgi:hypothetical protein
VSFRKDLRHSFEDAHGFGIADDDDLSPIDQAAIAAPLWFRTDLVPSNNPSDIPCLTWHVTAFCRGMRGNHMGNPLAGIDRIGRKADKDIAHARHCGSGVFDMR